MIVGTVQGVVTDYDTGQPLEGVTVSSEGELYQMVTGEDGRYHFPEVVIGEHELTFSKECWNSETYAPLEVLEEETLTVNHAMRYPDMELGDEDILVEINSIK